MHSVSPRENNCQNTPNSCKGRRACGGVSVQNILFPAQVLVLENPDSGLLKTRDVVRHLVFVRVDYCMYGRLYRKRTRLWTNCTCWCPLLRDRSHLVDNKHLCSAQRGGSKHFKRRFTRDELHRLPEALCQENYEVRAEACAA